MIECKFTKSIWADVFSSWGSSVHLPNSIAGYFADWAHLYLGKLPNNNWFKVAWMVYPKFIFWQIWIERNHKNFQEKAQKVSLVLSKANGLPRNFSVRNLRSWEKIT